MHLRTWLDDFPRVSFDEKLPAIQMGEYELKSTESFSEGQCVLHKQIITLSLELGVVLLSQNKHYIPSDSIWLQKGT